MESVYLCGITMKLPTKLTILFTTLCLPSVIYAQNPPTVKAAGIRIVNRAIVKDQEKLVPLSAYNIGTTLAMLIEADDNSILKIDTRNSTIDSFADDNHKELMVQGNTHTRNGFHPFPKISKDGKTAMVEINGEELPKANAAKVIAKGTLLLLTASKSKKFKSQPFEAKKGTMLKVGDIELKVIKAGKPTSGNDPLELMFESKHKDAVQLVAETKFYDSSGKEIESRETGRSSKGIQGEHTYGVKYSLKKSVIGYVVLEFKMWTDIAEMRVPFSVTAGIGG